MASIKVLLDNRRVKQDGTLSIIIRITHNRKSKTITTGFSVKEKFWVCALSQVSASHPESQDINSQIAQSIGRLYTLISYKSKNSDWNLDELVNEYHGKVLVKNEVTFQSYGKKVVSDYRMLEKHGTADWYQVALSSVSKCLGENLKFKDLTPSKCSEYERILLTSGCSINGVNSYMRAVRAIFNKAIRDELVEINCYPFNRFRIKVESTQKRNLTKDELRDLFKYKTFNKTEQMWLDVYKLSFLLMGMNFTDLISVRKSDVVNGRLNYRRAKTKKLFSVKLTDSIKTILNQYETEKSEYLLPILKPFYADGETQKKAMKDKLKQCNKYLKRIGKLLQFQQSLTTYTARHSWATTAKKLGYSNELIAEGLGHQYGNRITAIYLDSFNQEEIDEMNHKVSNTPYGC